MVREFFLIADTADGFAPPAQAEMRARLAALPSFEFGDSSFLLFPAADDLARYLQRRESQFRGADIEVHPPSTSVPR